jgi:hypothetical protein
MTVLCTLTVFELRTEQHIYDVQRWLPIQINLGGN